MISAADGFVDPRLQTADQIVRIAPSRSANPTTDRFNSLNRFL
jgi:hypothetical protein